ncbi:MAG: two-component regulator propeller domain-containing protein [Bacteroidota bacterium]
MRISIGFACIIALSPYLFGHPESWINFVKASRIQSLTATRNSVWAATDGAGLVEIPTGGNAIIHTRAEGILPSNFFRAATSDSHGTLWFLTDNDVVVHQTQNGNNWNIVPFRPDFQTGDALSIAVDDSGSVWIGTDRGILQYTSNTWSALTATESTLVGSYVNAITFDDRGRIWFGTDAGISVYDGKSWRQFTTSNSELLDDWVNVICVDPIEIGGTIWIGTDAGLCLLDSSLTEWRTFTHADSSLPNNVITSIIHDPWRNAHWVATYGGIVQFDNRQLSSIEVSQGLPSLQVRSLALDSSGVLFCGTIDAGIAYFDSSQWKPLPLNDGQLPSNTVSAIAVQSNAQRNHNIVWIGTFSGLARFENGTWRTFRRDETLLETDAISSLHVDPYGNLWIGSLGGGLSVFDGARFQSFTTRTSKLPNDLILGISSESSGAVWIATGGGGLVRYDRTSWQLFDTSSGLPTNVISSVVVSPNGDIWVGTYGSGAARFSSGTWTIFTSANSGLSDNHVTSIAVESNGTLWFGTYGGGICRFDGSTWETFHVNGEGPISDYIKALAFGQSDSIVWVGTRHGVSAYDKKEWKSWTTSNSGLAMNDVNAVTVDDFGNVWLGTNGAGLSIFNDHGIVLDVQDKLTRPLLAAKFKLEQNFPNPFNTSTTIRYTIRDDGTRQNTHVTLRIYDVLGREIVTLVDEEQQPGTYEVEFNASDKTSGVYLYRLQMASKPHASAPIGSPSETKKMLLLK